MTLTRVQLDAEAQAAAVDRVQLLAAILTAAEAGQVAPCVEYPGGGWTDDNHDVQVAAARVCRVCPALDACAGYGVAHPGEQGVYGGMTSPGRRRAAALQRAAS